MPFTLIYDIIDNLTILVTFYVFKNRSMIYPFKEISKKNLILSKVLYEISSYNKNDV